MLGIAVRFCFQWCFSVVPHSSMRVPELLTISALLACLMFFGLHNRNIPEQLGESLNDVLLLAGMAEALAAYTITGVPFPGCLACGGANALRPIVQCLKLSSLWRLMPGSPFAQPFVLDSLASYFRGSSGRIAHC